MKPSPFSSNKITRREFMKMGSLSLAGIIPTGFLQASYPVKSNLCAILKQAWKNTAKSNLLGAAGFLLWQTHPQGRVIDSNVKVFAQPHYDAERVKILYQDTVFPIFSVEFIQDTLSHNKVWYKIGEGQYVHSISIQPVNTVLNNPSTSIPEGGRLAEVTVPYTDAFWTINDQSSLAYRLYYGTTHWVIRFEFDSNGEPWYLLAEDKWDLVYYVKARHLRLIPIEELGPLSPGVPASLKRLEVHLSQQILVAYEDETAVFMARVASGGKFIDGNFTTQTGRFITFHKRPSRHMAAGNLAAGGYDLPGVPWISYFTDNGISFHGTYWHNSYGKERSHGCINLTPEAAKWVYRWTLPEVPHNAQMVYKNFGTPLDVIE